jgi:hypothetical protein
VTASAPPPPLRLRAWLEVLLRLRGGPRNIGDVSQTTFAALLNRSLVAGHPWRASLKPRGRLLLAVYDVGRADARRELKPG